MIFLIAASLLAKAQSDAQLLEVDALIEERRINEALIMAEEYIRENPDDFDAAQKRIDLIFQARNDYKEKADELVRIIVEEPLNDKLKLDIIEELETMEKNQSEEEKEFIAKIKITSQFTYFRALYTQVIEEGTALLNEKEYTASAARFTDGFELYYNDFFDYGFDEAFVQEVVETLAIANESVSDFASIQPTLNSTFNQFNGYLEDNNLQASLAQYQNIEQALNSMADVRNSSILAGYYFEEQNNILQEQDPELTDAFFLAFAFRLLLGRGDDNEAHIVKAMDTQWHDLYEETKTNISQMIAFYSDDINQNILAQTVSQIGLGASETTAKLNTLQSIIDMGKDFLSLYGLLNNSTTTFETNPHIEYEELLDYGSYLVAQGEYLINYANLLENQKQSLALYPVPQSPNTAIKTRNTAYESYLASFAQTTEGYAIEIENDLSEFQVEETNIASIAPSFTESESPAYPSLDSLAQTLQTYLQTLTSDNYSESLLAWETSSTFIANGSTLIREEYETPFEQSIPMINEALDIAAQSDPQGALTLLENIASTIDSDIASLQQEFAFLSTASQNESVGVPLSALYAQNTSTVAQDIDYLNNLSLSAGDYIVLAEQRVRLAQQAINEAELRFSQAEEYLAQENFAASRDALQRSRTQYNEALAYQYSDDLRIESDTLLADLGETISFTENEIVVRNVRNFITQSRQQYYNSNFTQAESFILQAEAQWAITNVQENPEVVALKALIGNALSITTGRTIPSTDPLYPEMSQTLNVAYQHYDNAENLLERNNRNQALAELELARNKIRDVQVLYPFHQEASLLALQIDELIDPVAFQEQFEQKFERAQTDYRDPATSSRAYIDLLDLYEINPDYPGLEDFIYVVELELGIILPPPDYAAIARSETLTDNAASLYNSGARDEISLNNALALLEEAIELNAENQDALILLDRINTSLGGATVIVLSSEAENLYQRAVQELSNGNTITAAALVSQLMQLPGVENSSKIIDLQRRVESLL